MSRLAVRLSRRRRARGQALIEFATFFLLIMFLLAGMIDAGGLLDDHVNIVYAARQGARTAAVMGKTSNADCAIIGSITAAMATMPNVQITRIVIYQADATGKPVSGAGGPVQQVYSGTLTCTVASDGTTTVNATLVTNNYPYTARNNTAYTEDSVGVEVDYNYTFRLPFITPLNGTSFLASDAAVMPISPISVPTPGAGATATPSAGGATPTPTCITGGPGPVLCSP